MKSKRKSIAAPFDPADWLKRAERRGYQIYLWDAGAGRLGLLFINPIGRDPDDLNLWWELRPNDAQADLNEKALRLHLWDIGQVGPVELRPEYAKRYTRAAA